MSETILIAGGAGFVGSNLACCLKGRYPDCRVIALDNLKRRGSELNLPWLREMGVGFVHGDVRNVEDLLFDEPLHFIIDAAAEPSVMAGMGGSSDYLIHSNLNGTINLLNLAVRHKAKFLFLSTSRIYPVRMLETLAYHEDDTRFALDDEQLHPGASAHGIAEDFPLKGARSLYGATKLASELILQEYQEFYGLQAVVNRCGVIAGPRQMGKIDQGVVTLWMAAHFWRKELAYIGYRGCGKQVRDALHILDLFDIIDYEMNNFDSVGGKTFNIGGGSAISFSLRELTEACEVITGNRIRVIPSPNPRPGDIPIYITDYRYATAETGWRPTRSMTQLLADLFEWIRANESSLKNILTQ
ncbi:MAG: NAD-dependent epimerase/dehydratase family protein [Tannerellaceae bacterium]|jgi:CDP-paratose 2-epimerase|nr:NAD-dependent epimerase/dehydratase family protein [Tannerellaceae bacterium]